MAKVLISAQLLESEYIKSVINTFGFRMHTPTPHTINTYIVTVEGEGAPTDDNLYDMLFSENEVKFVQNHG